MHGLRTIRNLNSKPGDITSLNDQVQEAWEAEATKQMESMCLTFWATVAVCAVVVVVAFVVI
jgi:hypothetical protein